MTQSLEELSSIYLESTESDLGSTQRFNVSLSSEEQSDTLPLTTSSSVTQEHFQIPEAGEGQTVIIELNVPTLQTEGTGALDQQDQQVEDQQSGSTSVKQPRKKRVTYDYIPADIKRKVVEYAAKHGTRPAAQLFDINEPTIRYWKQKGFAGSRGRKVTYGKELDKELHVGLMALKSNGSAVTVDQFTDYAKKAIDERRPELDFKCSRGWLEKFFKRHNLEVLKSPSGKVMDIVESNKEVDLSYLLRLEEDGDDGDEDDSSELNRNAEESFVLGTNIANSSEHLVEQNMSEDLSPPAKRMRLATSMMDQAGVESLPLSSSPSATDLQDLEAQKAKMLHIADILKKLKGNRPPLTNYQKQEVIDHARQNGSRSAERKYGVPETTIRYWVKKAILSPQSEPSLNSVSLSSMSSVLLPMEGTNSTSMSYSSLAGTAATGQASADETDTFSQNDTLAACQILHWAMDQVLHNERVGFDELCDRALSYISQTNPSSAYSSTRKWVKHVLDLKLRDLLNIQD